MANEFDGMSDSASQPARNASAVTPHVSDPLPNVAKGLYVGGAGDLVVRLVDDSADITLVGVPAGLVLPIRAAFVRATSTATNIVALY